MCLDRGVRDKGLESNVAGKGTKLTYSVHFQDNQLFYFLSSLFLIEDNLLKDITEL